MSKVIFHEFSPEIYPRKLWICICDKESIIEERFSLDSKYSSSNDSFSTEGCHALACAVQDKSNNNKGCLIVFAKKKNINFDIVSHESVHAADYICQELGILSQEFSGGNEHYAYLVGWIAKCCEQTKNYHNKH